MERLATRTTEPAESGVEANCFRGFSWDGFRDTYRFTLPFAARTEIMRHIADFYRGRGAKRLPGEAGDPLLRFRRGRWIWSLIGPGPETWPLQEVRVEMTEPEEGAAGATAVTVVYEVSGTGFLRFPPFQLKEEVEALYAELCTLAETKWWLTDAGDAATTPPPAER